MLGCYSFPAHVGSQHPETGMGIDIPTILEALRGQHDGPVSHARGCAVSAPGRQGFEAAVAAVAEADVAVVVLGDRAGLFGRGTSGEGCDAPGLHLPGEQQALAEAAIGTGTPVVVVVVSGRPYALGALDAAAALVQTFFPGQRGGQAIAEVLTGAVNPSGHLPVSIPRDPGSLPGSYLAPTLGRATSVSTIDPTALFPFGHGRSYHALTWGEVTCAEQEWAVDGEITLHLELTNEGDTEASDVVQVYLHDPVAQVARPEALLLGFRRVRLGPGERTEVAFRVHADLTSYVAPDGSRIVEPGPVTLRVARSSADVHRSVPLLLVGGTRRLDSSRRLLARTAMDAGGRRPQEVAAR